MQEPVGLAICGTNYGAHYGELFRRHNPLFRLVAIVAKGSIRSQEFARVHKVPLCRTVSELPESIKLAVVAIPSPNGHRIALSLLDRGIGVLREHPITERELNEARVRAKAAGTIFHVNSHFSDLTHSVNFAKILKGDEELCRPRFMLVTCSTRSVFATLEMIARVFTTLQPYKFEPSRHDSYANLDNGHLAFRSATAMLAGIPTHLMISAKDTHANDGRDVPTIYSISVGLPSRTITLCSPMGPIVSLKSYSKSAQHVNEAMWEVSPQCGVSVKDLVKQRFAANLLAVTRLRDAVEGTSAPWFQADEYLQSIARVSTGLLALQA